MSFAYRVSAKENGFWPFILQKGAKLQDRCPEIGGYADTYSLYAAFSTDAGRTISDSTFPSHPLQIGV